MELDTEKEILCKCGEIMTEDKFIIHFKKCSDFKRNFKQFDNTFSTLLKSYSEPKFNLLIARFLLKQYIAVLTKKIKT